MVVGHPYRGGVSRPLAVQKNIQQAGGHGAGDLDGCSIQIALNGGCVIFCDVGNHLQFRVCVARHNTYRDGSVDAATAISIGYDHGFHVLEDVAADLGQHFFRFSAQHLAQLGSTVRDGDGLCTPCCQQEFFLQDSRIGGYRFLVQHHDILLCIHYSIGPLAG